MIALSVALTAALDAQTNHPLDLYELQLDSGTYYYAEIDVTWNGQHYLPYVMSRSDVKRYMGQQFDGVTVTFSNVDTTLAQLISLNDIEGGILTIRRVDLTVTDDSLPIFIGQIQRPGNVDESICEIVALEYLGSIDADAPARLFDISCGLPFKGPECLYAGAATDCDHSWSNCALLGNTRHYGGFRFTPHSGVYQYQEVTQSRFLLFFTRKKKSTVTVSFASVDDTPYDVPVPIILGRAQVEAIPIDHEDAGPVAYSLQAFCVGPIYFFTFILANNTIVEIADYDGHFGEEGGVGSQTIDSFFPATYEYNFVAYIGLRIPSDVNSSDPAPSVTAVVGGLLIDTYDSTGAWAGHGWNDNAVFNTRAFMALSLARGGMGIPTGFFDDAHHFWEGVYTDEYIPDATNCQKIYLPDPMPDGFTVGDNYKRYQSTCVQGNDPAVDGPYSTFTPGVDDDTSRVITPINVKRFTVNGAIAEQGSAIDILFQKLLPAFRGYLKTSKEGKIQICCERANPHASVTMFAAAGATQVLCDTPSQFAIGDLLILSTFTVNAEMGTVANVLSDRIVLAAPTAKAHVVNDELLKVSMYFDDRNVVSNTPIRYPLSDRQSSVNRINVKYPDAPNGFEPRTLYVNDYDNQAKVRKINDEDLDGSAIDSYFQAWRIGEWKRAMYRDLGKFVSLRADISASALEIADLIAVSAEEHGLQCVPFRLVEMGYTPEDEVDLVGQLYSTAVYDDVAPQATVKVPSIFKAATPPTPSSGIATAGDGTITFKPITFTTSSGTSAITSAVIVLLYKTAGVAATAHLTAGLASGVAAGTAAVLSVDTDLTGIVRNGDWLLCGGEMMYVTADATIAGVHVERALGLTTSEVHAIGDAIYRLDTALFTYTFPPLFFQSANAASWGPTETLQGVEIALFNIVVYSAAGSSPEGPVNYSQAMSGLIETGMLSSGGFLAHGVVAPSAGAASVDLGSGLRSARVNLTEHTRISAINTTGLGAFFWVLTVYQDAIGGRAMIPGDGLNVALSSAQSPPNSCSTALFYYDGAGNHMLLASQIDVQQ